jgi:hypothetical protein
LPTLEAIIPALLFLGLADSKLTGKQFGDYCR